MARHNPVDPIDIHAAAILYAMRHYRGLSQKDIAAQLGVSFQQVQKYEHATNRMSAGTLYRLARILDIPVAAFFAGLDGSGAERHLIEK